MVRTLNSKIESLDNHKITSLIIKFFRDNKLSRKQIIKIINPASWDCKYRKELTEERNIIIEVKNKHGKSNPNNEKYYVFNEEILINLIINILIKDINKYRIHLKMEVEKFLSKLIKINKKVISIKKYRLKLKHKNFDREVEEEAIHKKLKELRNEDKNLFEVYCNLASYNNKNFKELSKINIEKIEKYNVKNILEIFYPNSLSNKSLCNLLKKFITKIHFKKLTFNDLLRHFLLSVGKFFNQEYAFLRKEHEPKLEPPKDIEESFKQQQIYETEEMYRFFAVLVNYSQFLFYIYNSQNKINKGINESQILIAKEIFDNFIKKTKNPYIMKLKSPQMTSYNNRKEVIQLN